MTLIEEIENAAQEPVKDEPIAAADEKQEKPAEYGEEFMKLYGKKGNP
jgi:hypothetical protein